MSRCGSCCKLLYAYFPLNHFPLARLLIRNTKLKVVFRCKGFLVFESSLNSCTCSTTSNCMKNNWKVWWLTTSSVWCSNYITRVDGARLLISYTKLKFVCSAPSSHIQFHSSRLSLQWLLWNRVHGAQLLYLVSSLPCTTYPKAVIKIEHAHSCNLFCKTVPLR